MRCMTAAALCAAGWCVPIRARAQETGDVASSDSPDGELDLTELSLEELMNVDVEVTSVAKRPTRITAAPAAVTVITGEELRRAGVTTIPEALRLVPGLAVGRVNSNTWAVTSRGFNGQFANKLLVLIDGRSVYTPLFSGVYWDVQDLLIEDIERIEVIRGPGAALWGANAVNGVINIITRSAREGQGALVSAVAGTEERAILGASFTTALAESAWLRVWSKWADHEGGRAASGAGEEDDWSQGRAGFRADGELSKHAAWTLTGDAYRGGFDGTGVTRSPVPPFTSTVDVDGFVRGEHLLGRVTRSFAGGSDLSFQAWFDSYRRETVGIFQKVDTLDVDFDHRLRLGERDALLWGAGYRRFSTKLRGTFDVELGDDDRTDDLFSAFVQEEHAFLDGALALTVGSKFEHNDFTGFEAQPNVRLAWTPAESQTFWASVARSVRTPSIAEDDANVNFDVMPGAPATVIRVVGNRDMSAERLVAWEAGWRVQPAQNLSFDLATFVNDYQDLQSLEPGAPFFDGTAIVVPLQFANGLEGRTWGVEAASQWIATPDWTLRGSYSFLAAAIERDSDSADAENVTTFEESFPSHQASLRSAWDLGNAFELDLGLFFVDEVPSADAEDYLRADVRLGWRPDSANELSLIVHGLLHHREREFDATFQGTESAPEAGILVRWTRRF